jgi:hypothetical protein
MPDALAPPAVTVTLRFTDVVDPTRQWARRQDQMRAELSVDRLAIATAPGGGAPPRARRAVRGR